MKYSRLLALLLVVLVLHSQPEAQTLDDLDRLWHQTFDALKAGQADIATESFGKFNQQLRLYLGAKKFDWKSEFLAGSLYCQFPQTRATGATMLKTVLQDERDLGDKGKDELRRLLSACTAPSTAPVSDAPRDLPADIIDASAHFQTPGVHSFSKGGYITTGEEVSGSAVSPKAASELLARRIPLSEPQKALDEALARLGTPVTGGIVGSFAITTSRSAPSRGFAIGKCLSRYIQPLSDEFDINPPGFMVTVYTADWTDQVYDYARRLHGLILPNGVVAYSVAEDMSLTGTADPSSCGSMAHELVHLFIKEKFPMSPAWMEEGLASEVAVAVPQGNHFRFAPSWRDRTLKENWSLRPPVGKLLDLSWSDFNAASTADQRRAAAVQAMAAVFIRYLDAKGKLPDVYFTVRDHLFGEDISEFRTYRQIVEERLGANVENIDKDFEKWFKEAASQSSPVSAGVPKPKSALSCPVTSPVQQAAPDCSGAPEEQTAH